MTQATRAVALLVVLMAAAASSIHPSLSRDTPLGPVTGNDLQALGVQEFVGIPYALPPTGARRFRPAVEVPPWSSAVDARKFRPVCPQNNTRSFPMAEDCLTVNIWAPRGAVAADTLPVLFFIHGGGFISGSGAFYNGSGIVAASVAAKQPVVVVTANYRLGTLGFLASDEIKAEAASKGSTGAANGLLDQLSALGLTHKIIAAFGGDAENTVIFGESAGALSVCMHLVSPRSRGGYTRAIMESGPCNGPWGPRTAAGALAAGKLTMASLNATTLAELRALPVAAFLAEPTVPASPGVDGRFLADLPSALLPEFAVAQAVILGSNAFDSLAGAPYSEGKSLPSTVAEFTALLAKYEPFASSPALRQEATAMYTSPPTRYGTVADAWVKLNADVCVICPTNALAKILVGDDVPVYQYDFNGPGGLAPHAGELPYVFGQPFAGAPAAKPIMPSPLDAALVTIVQDYWRSFAATGTPSSPAGPAWYTSTVSNREYVQFNTAKSTVQAKDLRAAECAFWAGKAFTETDRQAICYDQK